MAMSVSFDSRRFSRSFAKAAEAKTNIAEKWVRYECPGCGRPSRATLTQIARQARVLCGGCGKGVSIVDKDGGFGRGLKSS